LRSDVVYQTRAAIQFAFHSKHAGARQRKKAEVLLLRQRKQQDFCFSISFSREVSPAKPPGKRFSGCACKFTRSAKPTFAPGSTIMQTPFFITLSQKNSFRKTY